MTWRRRVWRVLASKDLRPLEVWALRILLSYLAVRLGINAAER